MPGALHQINVLEIAQVMAIPITGMLLSDMGADVVKLEPPWGDASRHTMQPVLPGESLHLSDGPVFPVRRTILGPWVQGLSLPAGSAQAARPLALNGFRLPTVRSAPPGGPLTILRGSLRLNSFVAWFAAPQGGRGGAAPATLGDWKVTPPFVHSSPLDLPL